MHTKEILREQHGGKKAMCNIHQLLKTAESTDVIRASKGWAVGYRKTDL